MSEHIFLITIGLPLATVLLIFGMKYFAAIAQAKARLASDEAYRQVAAQATAAQADTAAALAAINASLADIKTRVAAVEKMLRDVE
jgi:Tfp pilus assembly protein PilO